MKLLKIPWYLAIAVLLWSSNTSCKKDPNPSPSCNDGTCCGPSGYSYKFVTSIQNAPSDLGNGGFWLKDPINGIKGVLLCQKTLEKTKGLSFSYIPGDSAPPYKYRIWGEVYHNESTIGFYPDPIYEILISKIEEVN